MVEAIKLGVPVTGKSFSPGQIGSYTFNANRGDKIQVFYLWGYGQPVKLLDPSDRVIYEGRGIDRYGPNNIRANLTGSYTLVLDSQGQSLDYGFTVQRTNRPGNSTPIDFDMAIPDSLDDLGEMDTYTFAGTANTKIALAIAGGYYTRTNLFGPDGNSIPVTEEKMATLTQAGNYTILAYDDSGTIPGQYNLVISDLGKPKAISLNGTSGGNELKGGYGYDIINGLAGNDTVYGDHGNDRLLGGDGTDSLIGGPGEDILNGGKGSDQLIGEQGKDRFLFDTGRKFRIGDTGIDTIQDFDRFSDSIVLDKTTFTSLNSVAGTGFSVIGEFAVVTKDGAASTSKAEIVYNSTNGKLFYNPNGAASGYGEGGYFAVLTGFPALARGHFILQA